MSNMVLRDASASKNIVFKTGEPNIFKHLLPPLCLLFINWSVCHVLECSWPFSSGCQHCYKQIITRYKKTFVLICGSLSELFLVIPKSNISITIISHITSCLSNSHQGLSIAPCFVLLELIDWPRLEPLGDVWNCANPGFCVIDEN